LLFPSTFHVLFNHSILLALLLLCRPACASADADPYTNAAAEPHAIPIGLDAYREWVLWPYQRIGMRAYMRSTYDRRGGNEGADASHFLYQLADDDNVTLDVEGSGILYFVRFNHWHGSPWHFVVDGTDHLVRERSTADPDHPVPDSIFLPANVFPEPLGLTWSVTKGADLSWVPIAFEKSFRLGYSRTHYGTGYYIYDQFVPGTPLSQPLRAWDGRTPPDKDVLDLINRAGTDIGPTNLFEITDGVPVLPSNGTNIVFDVTNAPSMVRKLTFQIPRDEAVAFGHARLRITWDDRSQPSVDAPVALFLGSGTLYNRDNRQYLVKAFPSWIRFDPAIVELASFFPMPFFVSAKIELIGPPEENVSNVVCRLGFEPFNGCPAQVGYFHATYRDHPYPVQGQDLVLLDTRQTEGGGDWSGNFIGTSLIFSDRANLTTLEGDPRFFFDDGRTPQAYGTGTEEWGGGGDYWGGQNMTLPFAGHPTGARKAATAENAEDKIESAYRFLLADLMPFGKNARI
jgi:D-arabinan exo alpha-(1,3)/(1,5)-arabinofuranosidase (non-reducing end)